VNSPTATLEKVWVHRATGLVEKLIWTEVTISGSQSGIIRVKRNMTTKAIGTFDYEPIPDEMFAVAPPEDYTEWYVPLWGSVTDQRGMPIAGAVVYAWESGSLHEESGVTDQGGQWEIKLLPHLDLPAPPAVSFPIFLWAFRTDDPNWVAWTVIEDPNGKRTPAGTVLAEVNEIEVLDDNGYHRFVGGAGITLKMEPAARLFGSVSDNHGNPIPGADVFLRGWDLAGENDNYSVYGPIPLNYGPRVKTDSDGRYVLGNLPRLWPKSSIRIEVCKGGYRDWRCRYGREEPIETREFNIMLTKTKEVIVPTVTIRGKVKNDLGEPLVGYLVVSGHDEARTDKQGEFALDCAGIEDLSLTIRGNLSFGNWEFVYYPNKTQSIQYEPGKEEYHVEIVMEKPAIILDFVVKDTSNRPIQKALITLHHSDIVPFWNEDFDDVPTDANGYCTVGDFPRIEKPTLLVHHLEKPYKTLNNPISLGGDSKRYHIEVTLPKRNESIEPTVAIRPIVERK
jgi:protocatechuate 3,4-dioxygenase beta subunit